jgi:hypothetical protein
MEQPIFNGMILRGKGIKKMIKSLILQSAEALKTKASGKAAGKFAIVFATT